jgi:hypothetical protein
MTVTSAEAGVRLSTSITIEQVPARVTELCARPASSWTTEDLAYYIGSETARIHGPQLPLAPGRQTRIVPEFHERFGPDAVRIARHAFEARRGMWQGAPITLARFGDGHDEFFSRPILRELSNS